MMLGTIPRIDVMQSGVSQTGQPKEIRELDFKWLISTPHIMPNNAINWCLGIQATIKLEVRDDLSLVIQQYLKCGKYTNHIECGPFY